MRPLFDQAGFDHYAAETRREYASITINGQPANPDYQIERGRRFYYYINCCCGRRLFVPDFTNTCECGRDYNSAGQLLAPRSQWGEETGETADEILAAEARGFPED